MSNTLSNGVELPAWFKVESGFKFTDPDGDDCIILGKAGFRTAKSFGSITFTGGTEVNPTGTPRGDTLFTLEFHPKDSIVYAFKYKSEWQLANLLDISKSECGMEPTDWFAKCKPLWRINGGE